MGSGEVLSHAKAAGKEGNSQCATEWMSLEDAHSGTQAVPGQTQDGTHTFQGPGPGIYLSGAGETRGGRGAPRIEHMTYAVWEPPQAGRQPSSCLVIRPLLWSWCLSLFLPLILFLLDPRGLSLSLKFELLNRGVLYPSFIPGTHDQQIKSFHFLRDMFMHSHLEFPPLFLLCLSLRPPVIHRLFPMASTRGLRVLMALQTHTWRPE